uniref:MADS2p n=1 Tax=Chlamydomonas reinhardtii TaxID=3055 RepID=A8HYE1_CHLRE|nr:MADS2p [Chlamydomonas reinhardtii]|eukprot:XP_001696393.1 transcription factor-like protein [Chlamydomonas reinhardtii]
MVPQAREAEADAEGADDDSDEDSDENKGKVPVKSKGKSRRKASEKPEGSDQKRQAFSKRKRGLILKSYQLFKLTDAQVFVFIVNDKGSSWAYASPGFARTLGSPHLALMREFAGLSTTHRTATEIMPHPNRSVHNREEDDRMDDRPQVLRNNMVLEASGQAAAAATALSSTLAEYDRVAGVAAGPGAGGGGGRVNIALAAANAAAAAAAAGGPSVAGAAAGAQRVSPEADGAVAAVQPQEVADRGAGAVAVNGTGDSGAGPFMLYAHQLSAHVLDELAAAREDDGAGAGAPGPGDAGAAGGGGDTIITPSGRRLAAAIGVALGPAEAALAGAAAAAAAGGAAGAGVQEDAGEPMDMAPPPPQPPPPPPPPPPSGRAAGFPPPAKQPRCAGGDYGFRAPLPPHPHPHAYRHVAHDPHMDADDLATGPGHGPGALMGSLHHGARHILRGLGGSGGGGFMRPPPPQAPQPQARATSHATVSGSSVQQDPFMFGQLVQGSDGQLYRVLQELNDGEEYDVDVPGSVLGGVTGGGGGGSVAAHALALSSATVAGLSEDEANAAAELSALAGRTVSNSSVMQHGGGYMEGGMMGPGAGRRGG